MEMLTNADREAPLTEQLEVVTDASPVPLPELAKKIIAQVNKLDDGLLGAGAMVKQAKLRVEAGEVDLSWEAWCSQNLPWKQSWIQQLLRIGTADDPGAAARKLREINRGRVREYRARKARSAALRNGLEPERKQLVLWAETADLEDVKKAVKWVSERFPGALADKEPERLEITSGCSESSSDLACHPDEDPPELPEGLRRLPVTIAATEAR